MKKIKYLLLVLVMLFLVTGCQQEEKSKTMVCSRTINQDAISMDLKYTVTYKGKYVEKVETIEKITTDDATVLDTYKQAVETTYQPYSKIDNYSYDVKVEGNTLTSTVSADYTKIDYKKMLEVDSANQQIFTDDGKVKLETIESFYAQLGTNCTKEK